MVDVFVHWEGSGAGYGGGGVLLGGPCRVFPGEPGSDVGGVGGGAYINLFGGN